MPDERPAPQSRKPGREPSRRAYRTPLLVDYGPIARMTAGGSGLVMENIIMFLTKHP